jgi:hypothetical protein
MMPQNLMLQSNVMKQTALSPTAPSSTDR